jgi:Uri superfamily endonuclease
MIQKGAYILWLHLNRSVEINAGRLKDIFLPAGRYAYVGSARAGIAKRIALHKRLAETKEGKLHWHIDYLLVHPDAVITGEDLFSGISECAVSSRLASNKGVSAPAPGFGATDCRSGCKSHLYRLKRNKRNRILPRSFMNLQGEENGQSNGTALSGKRKKIH